MGIASASPATFCQYNPLTMMGHVGNQFACVNIINQCTQRNRDQYIVSCFAKTILGTPVFPFFSGPFAVASECLQCVDFLISYSNYRTTFTAITTSRASAAPDSTIILALSINIIYLSVKNA